MSRVANRRRDQSNRESYRWSWNQMQESSVFISKSRSLPHDYNGKLI